MDIYESAESLDLDEPQLSKRLRAIFRFAREHGCHARIVGKTYGAIVIASHVLVTNESGNCIATTSARRLAAWLGY